MPQNLLSKLTALTSERDKNQPALTTAWNAAVAAKVEQDFSHPLTKAWKALDHRDTVLMHRIADLRDELDGLEE